MKIKILGSARKDLLESYHFYELQQEGIGAYFLDALFTDIESLKLYAGIHPVFFEKYHRLFAKRFPFAIYYRVENKEISGYGDSAAGARLHRELSFGTRSLRCTPLLADGSKSGIS